MNAAGAVLAVSVVMINAAFAWLCGSLLAGRWLPAADGVVARGDRYALGAACAGGAAAMWSAFAEMAGLALPDVGQAALDILADTRLGQAYLLAMTALALAALTRVLRWHAAIACSLLLVFTLVRAHVSHAGGGDLFSAGVLVDAAHRVLAGVWLGSVFIAAWLVMPAAKTPPLPYMQRLSSAAAFALAGIVLTGLYGAWQRLGAPQRLFDHPYGLVLAGKLALFGVAASLGAFNRFIGFPAAARDGGALALLVLRVESAFLLAALGAAAVLTRQAPPQ